MAVASLVLGIVSLLFMFIPLGGQILGAITGLIGIILGASARKDPACRGMANAGLACSIVGFILSILFFTACLVIAAIVSA